MGCCLRHELRACANEWQLHKMGTAPGCPRATERALEPGRGGMRMTRLQAE